MDVDGDTESNGLGLVMAQQNSDEIDKFPETSVPSSFNSTPMILYKGNNNNNNNNNTMNNGKNTMVILHVLKLQMLH